MFHLHVAQDASICHQHLQLAKFAEMFAGRNQSEPVSQACAVSAAAAQNDRTCPVHPRVFMPGRCRGGILQVGASNGCLASGRRLHMYNIFK
jgi:hypothetical protein